MKNNYKKYTGILIAVIAGGLASGIVNGLFGTGGGIIIVYLFSRLYAGSDRYHTKDIFAMTVGSVLIMSAASLGIYIKNGAVEWNETIPYLIPAALGGILGAFLLDRIDAAVMKKIFAVLVVYAGITLMLR